ncbi:hypothetical protein A6F68_02014 [Tsuneonella dongtanensis]|uniref:Uncharacterized protein n=1 Tax=Tsuneonella dongtanensis TaxID=692370 RepID=A0A1B2AEE4_9SPHN|nr:hypothetical protein [Tsuneonella dongtanensis]ANY20522.1 hypothetical protein A6F68_02014 [Tsuneonella dongtanensis]
MSNRRLNTTSGLNGWILPLVVGGITGAFASVILLGWLGDLTPNGFSYLDLAAVLLTAVGVLVTVLGVAFAIAAVWGFSELKRSATLAAQEAAVEEVKEQIENGEIRRYLERAISEEINSDEMEERIKVRVDEVTFGNRAKDDELYQDDVEGEGAPDALPNDDGN